MSYKITYSIPIDEAVKDRVDSIRKQVQSRSHRAANELRNSALLVLRGQRSGQRYKVPGTYRRQRDKTDGKMKNGRYYTASAPGEPPAVRTGTFRNSWQTDTKADGDLYISRIESDLKTDGGGYILGEVLEEGTSRMAPRPYVDRTLAKAEPKIHQIFSEPYD